MLDFFGAERAVEDAAFSVGEPLLEDPVAAEPVAPDGGGDVAPEGAVVEIHVEGRRAEGGEGVGQGGALFGGVVAFDGAALAGHYGAAGAEVAPAGGKREIVAGHVAAVGRGGDGDGGRLRANGRLRDAGDGRFGVEQGGEFASAGGGTGEGCRRFGVGGVGPAGEGDARPLHTQRPGVAAAVGGIVEGGEDVMEQVFDAQAEAVEIASRRGRQVRATIRALVVAQPNGKEIRQAVAEIIGEMTDRRPARKVLPGLPFARFKP